MNQYTCHAEFNGYQYSHPIKAQNLGHAENGFEQWLWAEYNLTKDCAYYWLVAKAEHMCND